MCQGAGQPPHALQQLVHPSAGRSPPPALHSPTVATLQALGAWSLPGCRNNASVPVLQLLPGSCCQGRTTKPAHMQDKL